MFAIIRLRCVEVLFHIFYSFSGARRIVCYSEDFVIQIILFNELG